MSRAAIAALLLVVLCAVRGNAQPGTLKVSGSPGTMAIRSTAAAGLPPASVADATTTASIKTLAGPGAAKLTAQLNASMPAGVTLTISMSATPGGTSLGPVALDATARDVLTGIAGFNGTSTNAITYTLSATAAAGVIPLQSRTVTLTLTAAP
jgi:hypothetical protein